MGIWFAILIVSEIGLFLLYIYFWKRYPVFGMPFDYQYRVFKRAYRAYKPVRDGKMLYHVYATDFLTPYKHTLTGKQAKFQMTKSKITNRSENIRFTINGTDIFDWFKQKQRSSFIPLASIRKNQ